VEIKSRWSDKVLFAAEADSVKELMEKAIEARANLCGADLYRADLSGANLSGADLSRANLYGADLSGANLYGADQKKTILVGECPVFQITPIGSRQSTLVAFNTDSGLLIKTGCFFGTIDEFAAAVKNSHSGSKFEREYLSAIELIKVRFAEGAK